VADGGPSEKLSGATTGDQWIIKTNAILPNGKKLAATNIITRNGPDTITWQSKDRTLDGKGTAGCKGNQDEARALNNT